MMFRLLTLVFELLLIANIIVRCLVSAENVKSDGSNLFMDGIGSSTPSRRILQQQDNNDDDECSGICTHIPGSEMNSSVIPLLHDGAPFSKIVNRNNRNWSCGQWESYISTTILDCLVIRDGLSQKCCTNLLPSYECETIVENAILSDSSNYKNSKIPIITHGDPLEVEVMVDITQIEISNHGVNGGAVNIMGSIMLDWVDERLNWNYMDTTNNTGQTSGSRCAQTSIRIVSDKIWAPDLNYPKFNYESKGEWKYVESNSKATVLADGRVSWIRRYQLTADCITTLNGAGKKCSFMFQDHELEGSRINYVKNNLDNIDGSPANNGIVIHNPNVLSEYTIHSTQSSLSILTESGSSIASTIHDVIIDFALVPRKNECSICGHGQATLVDGVNMEIWGKYKKEVRVGFSKTTNISFSNCSALNELLETKSMSDETCIPLQVTLTEFCCENRSSQYDCEKNVHDTIVEELGDNTVTPPDPPLSDNQEENFGDNTTNDLLKVKVGLDVHHIVSIDVQENSIQMLLSLELTWVDKRLAWDPFIGGCHRVSYRASLDRELTEIWVPNIELVNKLEGLEGFPEVHASVSHTGRVEWRRTGVVKASCSLTGVKHFPYDIPSCYIEFGGTRSPLYDRVHYLHYPVEYVEYAENLRDESWNYQEYKILPNRTTMTKRIETLSGFELDVFRYNFYFKRASAYYTKMFVILYIFFTYLAFGMFFVDYGIGERLGYGSSVLFVIVATDITMTETTPVTNESLWIYRLSFASKMYVIVGLIQSIFVLWLYTRHDFDGETVDEDESDDNIELAETQTFINRQTSEEEKEVDEYSDSNLQEISKQAGAVTNNEENSESETKNGRNWLKTVGKRSKRFLSITGNVILGHSSHHHDSRRVRLIKHLRACDLLMFILCVVTYSLVILVLSLTLPRG